MLTEYHAKYFAYELTKAGGQGVERISQSLLNASVDLNPHQVEAALFALRSPLSKGVLLADEVGLGKTIEAGLVLCQLWAERKRRLMVVCPASLRKQWQVELEEKFNLPSIVIDAKSHKHELREGRGNPFSNNCVVITSYHFASKMADEIKTTPWDLVVIDEAHKLRNAYRESNKMGQHIRWALEDRRKILLTATPLQNSLSELYGLSTLIDSKLFGDLPTFRSLYANADGDLEDLRKRISEYCNRTLRKDVMEFIRYTERRLITISFDPTNEEQKFYEAVSEYLRQPDSYAFPKQQRQLMILVVRKLLASSPVALQGTLEAIKARLIAVKNGLSHPDDEVLNEDFIDEDEFAEYLDEIQTMSDTEESPGIPDDKPSQQDAGIVIDPKKLEKEIQQVERFISWSRSLGVDTKTHSLLYALTQGWEKMQEVGAQEKAVIFTESRRSMEYLRDFLEKNGYAGEVVCFSGGGKRDANAEQIYKDYMSEHQFDTTVNTEGSKSIMLRHALIDRFKNKARILIATEAGAEGINLQFCSLVINYDLPWNPQRIEQRIGRCHRYGQKYDVVVINFLNNRNAADIRVYQLLEHKFKLFNGIFGASDDVLGKVDNNSVGLEMRILQIYNQCRTEEEIQRGFDKLQEELEEDIKEKLQKVQQEVLDNFDEDVHRLLKINYEDALSYLDKYGQSFWKLTQFILGEKADFASDHFSFTLLQSPSEAIPTGRYCWQPKDDVRIRKEETTQPAVPDGIVYRLNSPLGEWVLNTAKNQSTSCKHVFFDISNYHSKISVLDNLKGKSGYLVLNQLTVNSLDKEEYLLFSGFTDNGNDLPDDVLRQFFKLDGHAEDCSPLSQEIQARLETNRKLLANSTLQKSMEINNQHFQERLKQLDRWVDDQIAVAERAVEQAKKEWKAARHEADIAPTITEKTKATERALALERKKQKARHNIYLVEDKAEEKRQNILSELKRRMSQNATSVPLFTIRWTVQ